MPNLMQAFKSRLSKLKKIRVVRESIGRAIADARLLLKAIVILMNMLDSIY